MIVYAAHSLASYGSEHDARQLAALRRHFPRGDVLDPAQMFTSDADWLDRWPDVFDQLDLLVVFADEAGFIGAGVLLEVSDAIGGRVPIVALDRRGCLRYFGGFTGARGIVLSHRRVGRPCFGLVLSAAEVAAAVTSNPWPCGLNREQYSAEPVSVPASPVRR